MIFFGNPFPEEECTIHDMGEGVLYSISEYLCVVIDHRSSSRFSVIKLSPMIQYNLEGEKMFRWQDEQGNYEYSHGDYDEQRNEERVVGWKKINCQS